MKPQTHFCVRGAGASPLVGSGSVPGLWVSGSQGDSWHRPGDPASHTARPALRCPLPRPAPLLPTGHLCVWPQLQSIASRPHLLTVHDFEQEGSAELDTVILKALVKGEGGGQPPAEARGRQAWGMVCPLGGSVAFYCR